MNDPIADAQSARENAGKHLVSLGRRLKSAEARVDEARDLRDLAIVSAVESDVLSPRDIMVLDGMPGESYIRRLLARERNSDGSQQ